MVGLTRKNLFLARIIIYLVAVSGVFFTISALTSNQTVTSPGPGEGGVLNLDDVDFNEDIVTIGYDCFTIYPGIFYSSDDFAAGYATGTEVLYEGGMEMNQYGTLRARLHLVPGETYAITARNTSYAQRLYIDGKEYEAIGMPGENAETTVPSSRRYMAGFTARSEMTEIILHYGAFVHADGGGVYPMEISSVPNIAHLEQQRIFFSIVVIMALLTAALFFLGLFLFFPESRYLLWFALTCVGIALRCSLTGSKVIMVLLPDLDWFLAIRLEYIAMAAAALFAILCLNGLFPRTVPRLGIGAILAVCVFNILFVWLAPSVVFTQYGARFAGTYVMAAGGVLLCIMWAIFRSKLSSPLMREEQILLLSGLLVFIVLSAITVLRNGKELPVIGVEYDQIGMIIFCFFTVLALALSFARAQRERDEARSSQAELVATNQMLERLHRVKSDFLDNLSHELRTPLAVIGAHAGGVIRQIERKDITAESIESLDLIQNEALRLGELVEQGQEISLEKQRSLLLDHAEAGEIIRRAAVAYGPACEKNQNRIIVKLLDDDIQFQADVEGLFQVLVNLILNANRHTHGGDITLTAGRLKGAVEFTVADNGVGIPGNLLPHVFERGVSGSGSTGLGLAICQDIISEHGGEIYAQSDGKNGTTIRFRVPIIDIGEKDS